MDKLLELNFSVFAMMAVGFLIRKKNIIGKEANRVITDLVIDVVLPCNIFASFLDQDLTAGTGDYISIVLISLGIQTLSVLYGKFAFPKEAPDRRISLSYAMIASNAGFLGNAIAEGLYGATGMRLNSLFLIPQRIMMWSEGLALYSGEKNRKATLRKVATHPCVIACMLGLLVLVTGLQIPSFLASPIQSIGKANTPLTMIMIGLILGEIKLKNLVDRTIVWFTLHRLVCMPLLVWGICLLLPVSKIVKSLCVLMAAMPAGATTAMLAAKYNRNPHFATRLVTFTTLCSVPAIVIWTILLR